MESVKVTFNTWSIRENNVEHGFVRRMAGYPIRFETWAQGTKLGEYPEFKDACAAIKPAASPIILIDIETEKRFSLLEID